MTEGEGAWTVRRAQQAHLGLQGNKRGLKQLLYFLDLIPPTILRLQTAVKLIKLSTVPTNGLGRNGALGMPSFTIRDDMSERQEESLRENLLASRQINIVEDNVMQFYIQF